MRAFYAVVIFFLTLAHLAALVFDPRHRVLVRNVHGVVELARIRHAQFARGGGVGRNLVVLGQVYVEASGVAGVFGSQGLLSGLLPERLPTREDLLSVVSLAEVVPGEGVASDGEPVALRPRIAEVC